MSSLTIEQAQATLVDLIHNLPPGEELVILENDQPVTRLVSQAAPDKKPRTPGSAKGKLIIHAEDDEHLADFQEYMP